MRACSLLVATSLLLASCGNLPAAPTSEPSYVLEIKDNISQQRFDLELRSNDSRSFCIEQDQWPDGYGSISGGAARAILIVGDERIPAMEPRFSTSCVGPCEMYRIEPSGTLQGFITYAQFGDPKSVETRVGKQLRFGVHPNYSCR